MASVSDQIQSADAVIYQNIESLTDQRALLSQNLLSQLRNLVEGVAVHLHTNSPDAEFTYSAVGPALDFVKSKAKLNFLGKFHKLIQTSASHYTLDGDASERLMLKYYEYLHRIRSLLRDSYGVAVLANLEAFPVDLDPSLREYHEKIAARIEATRSTPTDSTDIRGRYYIHKARPFFVNKRIYYEITLYRAVNKVSKFDRIIAFTHPALDNLKRKVTAQNSEFRTITSHIHRSATDQEYDLLIIDECSTVSNADLIKVLEKTSFKLLVLVGDVYQIESIQFGNWFGLIRSFIPRTSVFELTTPFRTRNDALLGFWNKVRTIEDDITEVIARNGYSSVLDKTLFETQRQDEIILCLNYDGLYGINNINRFLQSSNSGAATTWRETTYKVGDPVLFYETERFRPVIYNNLKGRIVDIAHDRGWIQFDVEIDRPVSGFDVDGVELEWVEGSTVRFKVYDYDASDDDDDSLNTSVPFQVAYAVSIHKAQGLEYDSVKIVITDANEDEITHSIFYTAVTRARERLRIFWTPETQQAVLNSLSRATNPKDVAILANRRGITPVSG